MSVILKYYCKTFLIFGLWYALGISLFDFFNDSVIFSLPRFLVNFFLFGTLMSGLLVTIHLHELHHAGINEVTDDLLNPVQKKFIPSFLSPEELMNSLKISEWNPDIIYDQIRKIIVIKSNFSFFKMGEKISIHSTELNGVKGYEIKSTPIFLFQYADMGRGVKNIIKIEKYLNDPVLN